MAISNYQLGPCKVEFPEGTDLGKTQGGVTVTVEETFAALNTDQDGESPVDEYVTGTQVTVEGNLAEITLDNVAKLYKQEVVGTGDSRKVEISTNVGTSLLSESDVMIIKPYDGGTVSGTANDWITLHHAALKATGSLSFNATDQRVLAFSATGYPDSATGLIATFGDTAAS